VKPGVVKINLAGVSPGEFRPITLKSINMKTILTLFAVTMFTITSMAADRHPTVTIKTKNRYEVVVDGKRYRGDNFIHIKRMRNGMHNIKVYERSRGLFNSRLRLVSTRNFIVRNNDLRITVDFAGRTDIDEFRDRRGRGNDRYDRDFDRRDDDWGRNDRKW